MPTADQSRLNADRARPRITELWWALRPLTSVVRFMQTGAHPDDEISGMLAALAYRDGINLSYACSTRGEGGQNDVGTETGAALGALRTREMEQACDILGMRMYWHCETPADTITDFGFSKSGEETLERWGKDRTLARFVDIVRTEKPDIICPTFLDVPGQHGHHRAITQAAHDVIGAAADPAFPSDLPVWQVKKMYLPAWSGAGQAYDDDLPPPPVTLTISGQNADPVSGWSWERIGEHSRACHRTQGMGRWVSGDFRRDWPLHLAESCVAGPDKLLTSGLPTDLGALAQAQNARAIAVHLIAAQSAIDTCVAAFPAFDRVAEAGFAALALVRAARENCPDIAREDILHRLLAKEVQLGHVIRLALGVDVQLHAKDRFLMPGQSTEVLLDKVTGAADSVALRFELPDGWRITCDRLEIAEHASPTAPYPVQYDPARAEAPACVVTIEYGGAAVDVRIPIEVPPVILPSRTARVVPDGAVINCATPERGLAGRIEGADTDGAKVTFALPDGWTGRDPTEAFRLEAPQHLEPGRYDIPVRIDGQQAMDVQRIDYAHIAPTAFAKPAILRVVALNAELPDVKIGYVGAGNDRVNHWLRMLGASVTDLKNADLGSDTALAQFDTIIVGIFAMRFREGLAASVPRLHRWTEAGGTLLTLYHRPWDNWDPEYTPLRRLEIGQPSLRWRVTDETAEVRHLTDHSVLSWPNAIGREDWRGWVKERGLYFAKSWDPAYTPLIEMADPGEVPHRGSLLVADVGQGRHVHTSLILHHQMENLVPGAFRLMANLIARRA